MIVEAPRKAISLPDIFISHTGIHRYVVSVGGKGETGRNAENSDDH